MALRHPVLIFYIYYDLTHVFVMLAIFQGENVLRFQSTIHSYD